MFRAIVFLTSCFFTLALWAQSLETKATDKSSHFAGRISRLNRLGKVARIRTDYGNIKFLRKRDRLDFWNESYPDQKCASFVEGRTNDYLLLRIPRFDECIKKVHFTTGTYLHFSSADLDQTIGIATELVEVLQKKRMIMDSMKRKNQRELDGHVEKVNVVNQRYEILRQKLEIEWKKELGALEEDKARIFTEYKESEARLNEIDVKLEAYRIEDHNLKLDRWSLDPALYQKK